MMIEPPIDELAAKMGGNKYKLCCVMEKRAKELEKTIPAEIEASDKKTISMYANEIYKGKVISSDQVNK